MTRNEQDSPKEAQGTQLFSQDRTASPSFSQRVGASASRLFQDAVLRPSSSTATTSLASSSAAAGKGESSSSSIPAAEASRAIIDNGTLSSRSQSEIHGSANSEPFRSQQVYGRSAPSPAQQGIDAFLSDHNAQIRPTMWSGGSAIDGGTVQMSQEFVRDYSGPNGPYSFPVHEDDKLRGKARIFYSTSEDGAAVVALLSDPTFSPEGDPTDETPIDSNYPEDLFRLSSTETQFLRHLKTLLPDSLSYNVPAPSNPSNLVPDFTGTNENVTRHITSIQSATMPHADESYLYTTKPSLTRSFDIDPWLRVLTNYQDDVWGDMLPLVKEARKEVLRAKEEGESTVQDSIAVRRLSMIIGHLK
ncbi:hypothetical protein MMC20_001557 [Loxospora ochrophaea]|nr:hypothetical protein [Loxospora ochrophaea]